MKKSEAKPGTKVIATYQYGDEYSDDTEEGVVQYTANEYDDYTLIGVIRSQEAAAGKVWVKWIEGELTEEDDREVELKVLSLESERSQLDKEFKEVERLIQAKMKEAAKLLSEAGKMAKPRRLASMYDAVRPLVDAMDNNGWRSSSWGC